MDPESYLMDVRHHFMNEGSAYEEFLQTMQDFNSQKLNNTHFIQKLMILFHGQAALIMRFNDFLPKQYKIVVKQDDEAFNFVKRVQTTFKNDHGTFSDFLQILDAYRHENKSITEVYNEIAILFWGHNDLLIGFKSFLPDLSVVSSSTPTLDLIRAKKRRLIEEKVVKKRVCVKGLSFFDKVKATLGDSDICQGLTKCVELYSKEIITRLELQDLVDDLLGECPEMLKGFNEFMKNSEKTRKLEGVCTSKSVDDYRAELDLWSCEQITPSYRLLPMNCRNPGIRHESLDDGCVCKYLEKGVFPDRDINKSENNLFNCEDKMFELDMKMHLTNAAVDSATELLRKMEINLKLGRNSVLCLEEHFTEPALGCIKKLFAYRGPKFLDSLKENAPVKLPFVLKRLILEQEKLSRIRKGSKIGWSKIFSRNHQEAYYN